MSISTSKQLKPIKPEYRNVTATISMTFLIILLVLFIQFNENKSLHTIKGAVLHNCSQTKCEHFSEPAEIKSPQSLFLSDDVLFLKINSASSDIPQYIDLGHHAVSSLVVIEIKDNATENLWDADKIKSRQNRTIGGRYFSVFPNDNLKMYIKFNGPASVQPQLIPNASALDFEFKDSIANIALIFGILLIGTVTRISKVQRNNSSYLLLCISMSLTLICATGISRKILWQYPNIDNLLLALSHSLTPWVIIEFYRTFFLDKRSAPKIYKSLSVVRILLLCCFPVYLINSFLWTYINSLLGMIFASITIAGIIIHRKTFDKSQYTYAIGMLIFMLFSTIYTAHFSGLISISSHPHIFLSLGMFADSMFLSVAINTRNYQMDIQLLQLSADNSEKTKQILELASTSFDTYIETTDSLEILNVDGIEILNLKNSIGANLFEILAHKNEILAHKNEILAHKNEILAHKNEILAHKNEIQLEKLQRSSRQGSIRGLKLEIENASGESVYLILNGHRFENAAGEMHWKFALMDRTAQAQAELHSLRSANLAELGRLSGSITHEINNPLTSIRIYCDNMLEELQDSKECSKVFKAPLESMSLMIDRVSDTVKSVRALYRSGVNLDFETFKVKEILEDASKTLTTQIQMSKTLVTISGPALNETIVGDPRLLTQIFTNLIKNSIDAMANCPVKEINISANADANLLRIHLEDSGTGVPAHAVSKLFDPFYTTKGGSAGSGLGLALCQTIATKHKGVIQYLSDKGGAHFVFEMPIRQNSDPNAICEGRISDSQNN